MYARVLVGTDGSETATRAVESAAVLAQVYDAELIIGHAHSVRPPAAQRQAWADAPEGSRWRLSPGSIAEATVDRAIRCARRVAGDDLVIAGLWAPGRAAPVLVDAARNADADVLVIGNRDGRIQRAVCRRAACDVVIVDTTTRYRRPHARLFSRRPTPGPTDR